MDLATVTYTSARGIARVALNRPAHMRSKDAAEGLAAFAARRPPIFTD
jgi:hypothetical protein